MGDSNLNPALSGLFPHVPAAERLSLRREVTGHVFQAAVAATTAELILPNIPPGRWRVAMVHVESPANRSADTSPNMYTLAIAKRVAAASSTILSATTEAAGIGALTAFVPKDISALINQANAEFDGRTDQLTLTLTKGGTGADVAAGTSVRIELQRAS